MNSWTEDGCRKADGGDVPPILDFRHFWREEAARGRNCPPVRVKLRRRTVVAFPRIRRDRYGLKDEFCAHRGVSLWCRGRNEEVGAATAPNPRLENTTYTGPVLGAFGARGIGFREEDQAEGLPR